MGALPKRKSSKARSLKRRSADKLSLPQLVVDKTTNSRLLPHTVNLESGTYKGKKVLKVKTAVKKSKKSK